MELKFGHRVIAWKDNDAPAEKGRYVSYYYSNDPTRGFPHYVLLDGTFCPTNFRHAQLDPEGPPMTGDEVEYGYEGEHFEYHGTGILCGEYIDPQGTKSFAIVTEKGELRLCKHVRFPQQSKREKVWEILSEILCPDVNTPIIVADQIDKIYKEGS